MKSIDWRSSRFVFKFYLGFDKADELYDTGKILVTYVCSMYMYMNMYTNMYMYMYMYMHFLPLDSMFYHRLYHFKSVLTLSYPILPCPTLPYPDKPYLSLSP